MVFNPLEYIALLLAVTAGFSYLNHYFLRLPRNSALLIIALVVSSLLRVGEYMFPSLEFASVLRNELERADFSAFLLHGALGLLLFAGAINVNVNELLRRKWTILALSVFGVIVSTAGIAAGMYFIFQLVGIKMPVIYCLVFGALISPTDPVTVLAVISRVAVPSRLQAIIAGESLFNDGIGIVLFSIFLAQATGTGSHEISVLSVITDFVREGAGGAMLGLAMGGLAFVATRGIEDYNIELMISLALATGAYGIAQTIGVSGPVAVVVAGLLMGSVGVKYAVSGNSRDYLEKFWSLTDEVLNSLLFMLIGLEFAAIDVHWTYLVAMGLAVPLSLLVRAFSIAIPSLPLNLGAERKLASITLLTWSGLRGGISVALALSLPQSQYRDALVTVCYGVAVFTMLVQGLSLGRVATRLYTSESRQYQDSSKSVEIDPDAS